MALKTQRLDRFLSEYCGVNRKDVRLMLAQQRVTVDGELALDIAQKINTFSHIILDDKVIQQNSSHYIMLNKPIGVVCATKDDQHKTVIDLLKNTYSPAVLEDLHIVGRLDLNTSGLVLLTNDSRWSERLTLPESKVPKRYVVTLQNAISSDYVEAFAQGMYFSFEQITTKPAQLTILAENKAEVILTEGKYHQIKRMFGRFRNPVIALHRDAIGSLSLDNNLELGESRLLSESEVTSITQL